MDLNDEVETSRIIIFCYHIILTKKIIHPSYNEKNKLVWGVFRYGKG